MTISRNLEHTIQEAMHVYMKALEFHQYCGEEERTELESLYLNNISILNTHKSVVVPRYALWYNQWKERQDEEYHNREHSGQRA